MTFLQTQQDNRLPLTRIQKLIGAYMHQSKQTKPSAYLRMRADLTELVAMRKTYCRAAGVRAATNDFFIYAIARAVKEYPLMAAAIDVSGTHLVIPEHIGVGFAVAAPQGLVVPVLKEMERKNLARTAVESEELLKKARSGKLLPDDFDGANMVLTGLGMYGIESFYAISPPSATGIVSIGNIEEQVVPTRDGVQMRKMMYVAMAFDQRIVDEFYAAGFLRKVVDSLQNPTELTTQ
jgi:pyruvate dehydrogenase E2 component (dihydrolipoamide acetyltransferase)